MSVAESIIARASRRPPDFIIGESRAPYLHRWWLIPRNPLFNVYLHRIMRSDDNRALHDHPWFNASVILRGGYVEHTIAAGGIHRRVARRPGGVRLRAPWNAHRLEITDGDCWSLFLTGPKLRVWGFHCATRWVPWRDYTALGAPGSIGRGCE